MIALRVVALRVVTVLALAFCASAQRAGRVVLAAGDVKLDGALARELGGDERVSIACKGDASASDPLDSAEKPASWSVLDPEKRFAGDDRALAQRVEKSRCIVLSGGTWLGWYALLEPQSKESRLSRALRLAHDSGATVVGQGAAAAYLAQWTVIARASLSRPARNPHEPLLDVVVEGLGLVDGCVDLASGERASPERMLAAAVHGGVDLALWFDGQAAWIFDPSTKSARIEGRGAVCIFDLSRARRSRSSMFGARVSLATAGESFDSRERALSSVREESAAPETKFATFLLQRDFKTTTERAGDFELTFRANERSRFLGRAWIGVEFDFQPIAR